MRPHDVSAWALPKTRAVDTMLYMQWQVMIQKRYRGLSRAASEQYGPFAVSNFPAEWLDPLEEASRKHPNSRRRE